MTPEEWREVDSLVQAAFDRPPEERAAFLSQACAGRPDLRHEVTALLEADAGAQDFLDQPYPSKADLRPQPGLRIGPYQLLEEIGYGGFCRVYRAERVEEDFTQEVAVKIVDPGLDFGFGDDTGGDIAQRFRMERQILAQLGHPSIARLVDGGEVGGRPFFVMEFVDGKPIDRYCAEHGLDLQARLRLMLLVIDAVAYAHEHLIVHRDLKPGNLLVSSEGVPKLLDFGIAKVLEPEALALSFDTTRSGLRPMTPAWAAPEQVRGEAITTATDVYGLGLLLYFLLTGERAYELGDMTPSEMEQAICDVDPLPPSRRLEGLGASSGEGPIDVTSSRLEGDLDAIVMATLAKDPLRRYRTVRELAEDIERFLSDAPVSARSATWLYRSGKWLRRHRWASLAAVAAMLTLFAFILVLLEQAKSLEAERDFARQESSRAEEVSDFLVEIFAEADPGRTQGKDLSVRRILEEGQNKIERLEEPAAKTELLATLGSVHAGLGEVPEGVELLRRARQQAVALYGPEHAKVAEIDHRLGMILLESDRFAEAEETIGAGLDLRRRILGEDDPETSKSLALWGQLRSYQGFKDEARGILFDALARLEAAGPGHEEAVIKLLSSLAGTLPPSERDEARSLLERRLRMARDLLGANHPLVPDTLLILSFYQGDREKSVAMVEEARDLQDKLFDADHPQQARACRALSFLTGAENAQRALELSQRSFEINSRVWGPGTWTLSLDHTALARAHHILGDREKAAHHWRMAAENARQGTPITHPWRVQVLVGNVAFFLTGGQPEEALTLLEEAAEIRAGLPHRRHQWDSALPALKALAQHHLGDPSAAAELQRLGPEALQAFGPGSPLGSLLRAAIESVGGQTET